MRCENCKHSKNCKSQCMDLPEGKTCANCVNIDWCEKVYGVKETNTKCDFEPVRFMEARKNLRLH